MNMLRHGKCDVDDCNYAHDDVAARRRLVLGHDCHRH